MREREREGGERGVLCTRGKSQENLGVNKFTFRDLKPLRGQQQGTACTKLPILSRAKLVFLETLLSRPTAMVVRREKRDFFSSLELFFFNFLMKWQYYCVVLETRFVCCKVIWSESLNAVLSLNFCIHHMNADNSAL